MHAWVRISFCVVRHTGIEHLLKRKSIEESQTAILSKLSTQLERRNISTYVLRIYYS